MWSVRVHANLESQFHNSILTLTSDQNNEVHVLYTHHMRQIHVMLISQQCLICNTGRHIINIDHKIESFGCMLLGNVCNYLTWLVYTLDKMKLCSRETSCFLHLKHLKLHLKGCIRTNAHLDYMGKCLKYSNMRI